VARVPVANLPPPLINEHFAGEVSGPGITAGISYRHHGIAAAEVVQADRAEFAKRPVLREQQIDAPWLGSVRVHELALAKCLGNASAGAILTPVLTGSAVSSVTINGANADLSLATNEVPVFSALNLTVIPV